MLTIHEAVNSLEHVVIRNRMRYRWSPWHKWSCSCIVAYLQYRNRKVVALCTHVTVRNRTWNTWCSWHTCNCYWGHTYITGSRRVLPFAHIWSSGTGSGTSGVPGTHVVVIKDILPKQEAGRVFSPAHVWLSGTGHSTCGVPGTYVVVIHVIRTFLQYRKQDWCFPHLIIRNRKWYKWSRWQIYGCYKDILTIQEAGRVLSLAHMCLRDW